MGWFAINIYELRSPNTYPQFFNAISSLSIVQKTRWQEFNRNTSQKGCTGFCYIINHIYSSSFNYMFFKRASIFRLFEIVRYYLLLDVILRLSKRQVI